MKRLLAILLALSLTSALSAADIWSNLLIRYGFEGSPVPDLSNNGRNGTWVGTPATATGKIGTLTASFSGGNRVDSPTAGALTEATFTFWMKPTVGSGSQWINDGAFHVAFSGRNFQAGTLFLQFYDWWAFSYVERFGYGAVNFSDYNSWPAGVWTHIALTHDKANSQMKMYANGVQVASTYSGTLDTLANQGWSVGTWDQGGRFFDGQIDDFRVYGRVLSSTDLQALVTWRMTQPNNQRGSFQRSMRGNFAN